LPRVEENVCAERGWFGFVRAQEANSFVQIAIATTACLAMQSARVRSEIFVRVVIRDLPAAANEGTADASYHRNTRLAA
jgi:hypothetical protein